jgi:hypothetical protein
MQAASVGEVRRSTEQSVGTGTLGARAPGQSQESASSKRTRDAAPSGEEESTKRAREAEGGVEADRGAALMKEVQARLGSDSAYRHFKVTLKEALVSLKKSAKSSAAGEHDLDQQRKQVQQALETIKWLFSQPALATSPPLAERLIPLLPSKLVDEFRKMLGLGSAAS